MNDGFKKSDWGEGGAGDVGRAVLVELVMSLPGKKWDEGLLKALVRADGWVDEFEELVDDIIKCEDGSCALLALCRKRTKVLLGEELRVGGGLVG